MVIKAIETRYAGYRFRSRLEARWAVFFDSLGLKWEYEPEGFDLGEAGLYLPDFYLPSVGKGLWVEIKAKKPTSGEEKKLHALIRGTGKMGTFRVGEPFVNVLMATGQDGQQADGSYDSDNAWMYLHQPSEKPAILVDNSADDDIGGDGPYLFCTCPWCGKIGFEFDGRGARVCGYKAHYETEEEAQQALKTKQRVDDKCYSGDDPKILSAAIAARSARFEHGQKGAAA